MRITEIFNDFYALAYGKRSEGIVSLLAKYQEQPLFALMLTNLDRAAGLDIKAAMNGAHGIFKEFSGMEMTPDTLERLYEKAKEYDRQWDNLWCRQLILAIIGCLDPDAHEAEPVHRNTQQNENTEQTVEAA